jgi:hypothetical protein
MWGSYSCAFFKVSLMAMMLVGTFRKMSRPRCISVSSKLPSIRICGYTRCIFAFGHNVKYLPEVPEGSGRARQLVTVQDKLVVNRWAQYPGCLSKRHALLRSCKHTGMLQLHILRMKQSKRSLLKGLISSFFLSHA